MSSFKDGYYYSGNLKKDRVKTRKKTYNSRFRCSRADDPWENTEDSSDTRPLLLTCKINLRFENLIKVFPTTFGNPAMKAQIFNK